jgi:hypothetical protein
MFVIRRNQARRRQWRLRVGDLLNRINRKVLLNVIQTSLNDTLHLIPQAQLSSKAAAGVALGCYIKIGDGSISIATQVTGFA